MVPSTPEPAAERAPTFTRRSVLGGLGATALAAVAPRALGAPARPGAQPRIAVIGAGLAGLTCALRLHQSGISSTVYEAHTSRIGGRCWTAREFAAGQTGEHGGEYIDTVHRRIRGLAAELGLTLDDVKEIEGSHHRLSTRIFLDGAVRTYDEVYGHQQLLTRKAHQDAARIGSWQWSRAGAAARALDEMTAQEWLDEALPDVGDRLLRLATKQYMSEEYGLDVDRLSAITMVSQFGPRGLDSDERFHVHGGNDLVPHGVADLLPAGTVQLAHPLRSLTRRGSSYALTFHGRPGQVVADQVVLALPFPALRLVELDGAGLSLRKRRCIDELGMGTDAKLLIQFREHLGHYDRFDGEYYDEHIDTWTSTFGETGRPGLLTVYAGGRTGAEYPVREAHATAPAAVVDHATAQISRAVTGLAQGYNGIAWLDHWASDPWTHGSYAAFLPGQFTRYSGFVGLAEGGLHFAGEHTSTLAQGYMEGAVRSGERAAAEVVARAHGLPDPLLPS